MTSTISHIAHAAPEGAAWQWLAEIVMSSSIPTASSRPVQRRLITIAAAAEVLGISARSVWRLISAQRLQVVRIGKAVRINLDSIDAFISSGGAK